MLQINPGIFREYDIRGIVDKDLSEQIVEIIAKAYGTYLSNHGKKIVSLGRDCRESSPLYSQTFCKGLNSCGIDVVDLGMVSTPMVYFSLFNLEVGGGAMITASHNPSDFNGIKLCIGRESLYGSQIQEIRQIAESGEFAAGNGKTEKTDIMDLYINYLTENIDIKPGLKVGIDCGNGMGGLVGPDIIRRKGCEVTELYTKPDGNFPNHHPDPTVEENLQDLIKVVKENCLDIGIGFDGDADRIGVVDENGNIVWGDMLMLILARDVLKEVPGAQIIGDVKCSGRLFNAIEQSGGKPLMWKTGHSLIKSKMKEQGAELAGEMSGHIFFSHRFFGYDDAVYAALRVLEILSKTGKTVSDLLSGVPEALSTPEIRVDCPDDIKFKAVDEVKKELSSQYEVNGIDGLRIEFPDGWGLLRASNTQPAVVLRFEAQDENRLKEIRNIVETPLKEAVNRLS
ncbi:MAG TPA: phosphomannomutase/phosphoglucomutase [Thermodesulfobacteriota bacterium]|nr:phosphomannomutase/phosphoglucomutase [Thermodesulfobacteriota bacterium]